MAKQKSKDFKRYMLVDGNALIHRAFHAIQHLSTKTGEPTNAVYGFSVILLKALKDINPTHVAMTFDLAAPTFRHQKYKEYKATRVKAADELYAQIPRCKEVVRELGIPIFEMEGYEADDLLGTLSEDICKVNMNKDFEALIVTGDMDTLQLVNTNVKIYTARKGLSDVVVYDINAIFERYGIRPDQVVDFKAIKGDPSDNIPGVAGIGEKGALDLIKQFGSVKNIYSNLDKLKEKTRKLFEEQKDMIEMSLELSKINCEVPLDVSLQAYSFKEQNYQNIVRLFQDLEFKSLIAKLPKVEQDVEKVGEDKMETPIQERKNDTYYYIDTIEKLNELSTNLLKQEKFAFDTETDGLGALEFNLVGLAFSYKEGEAYYVSASLLNETKFDGLKRALEDPKIRKIAHNIKYDYLVMKKFGIEVTNLYFDTMIASYLLGPGSRTHDLDTLTFNEFGYQMQPIGELIGKGKSEISLKDVDPEKVSFYCCEDVDYTFRLEALLLPRLKKEKLENIFFEIEMPLTQILAEMEENGILLDTELFSLLEKKVTLEIIELEKKIYTHAGEEFNINSPTQLKVILFDKLKISVGGTGFIKKTKTGFSTAASELEKMREAHPIIAEILNYRELAKLQSTYIKALPELISSRDRRLHTSFNQIVTATGRLSSSNPNLQNIPVGSSGVAAEIRKGFIAKPGYTLLAVDYSQIELRVVAHLAQDQTMMQVFKDGRDIHAATAMQLYGISDPAKITKEMRRDAKTINFGVLYGVSSFGLSERVDMTRAEAADFIKKYYQAFPAVEKFLKQVIEQTKQSGFAENEIGRKRYMPEINSSQFMVRAGAERAAINMPIQSLAADILKKAMININAAIDIQSEEISMLLQVHDELVFEVKEGYESKYAEIIRRIMQEAYALEVPLIAEAKVGKNWGDMSTLEFK